jgi:RNA polymerase sigma-70 factor (ECF subfamily)
MVMRRCRALLKNEDAALDAMQDTFVKVLRYKERLSGNTPSSLLYRIATNVCLNILRRKNHESDNNELLLEIASTEDIEKKTFVNDFLERIFKTEHVSTKTIAVLRYIDKMTWKEVAKETGLSVSGVRKRLRMLKLKTSRQREKEL